MNMDNKARSLPRACAFALAVFASAASAASESIETSIKNFFKAADAGDRATVLAYGPSASTRFLVRAFDYDWENKPVAFEGAAAVNGYFNSLLDEMAKRKMKLVSVVSDLQTGSSSPELGFASFVITQTMTAQGQSETSRYRSIALLNQDAKTGKWRFIQWLTMLMPAAPTPGSTAGSVTAANKALLLKMWDEVYQRGDLARVADYFTADVVHNGWGLKGLDKYASNTAAFFRAFANVRFPIRAVTAEGDYIMVLSTWTAEQVADFGDIKCKQGKLSLPIMNTYRFENGKIAEIWATYDRREMRRQLGAAP